MTMAVAQQRKMDRTVSKLLLRALTIGGKSRSAVGSRLGIDAERLAQIADGKASFSRVERDALSEWIGEDWHTFLVRTLDPAMSEHSSAFMESFARGPRSGKPASARSKSRVAS